MKIIIEQNLLIHSIERGGLAALSEEASSDKGFLSPVVRSVKILLINTAQSWENQM